VRDRIVELADGVLGVGVEQIDAVGIFSSLKGGGDVLWVLGNAEVDVDASIGGFGRYNGVRWVEWRVDGLEWRREARRRGTAVRRRNGGFGVVGHVVGDDEGDGVVEKEVVEERSFVILEKRSLSYLS
jgi:hypothetical protein